MVKYPHRNWAQHLNRDRKTSNLQRSLKTKHKKTPQETVELRCKPTRKTYRGADRRTILSPFTVGCGGFFNFLAKLKKTVHLLKRSKTRKKLLKIQVVQNKNTKRCVIFKLPASGIKRADSSLRGFGLEYKNNRYRKKNKKACLTTSFKTIGKFFTRPMPFAAPESNKKIMQIVRKISLQKNWVKKVGGIRTRGALYSTLHFKCIALNRAATTPPLLGFASRPQTLGQGANTNTKINNGYFLQYRHYKP